MTRTYLAPLLWAFACNAQYQQYLSRPDIRGSVAVQILQNATDSSVLAPGYFFLAPYIGEFTASSDGPQIIDGNGNLIWYGNASIHERGMDLHVCDYQNTNVGDHLCLHDAAPIQQGGHSSGPIVFLDRTYAEVDRFGASGGLIEPDIHELNTPTSGDGSSFIQDVYQTIPVDLSAFNGPSPGYALSGCFQEIDIASRAVIFQWCSLDHVPIEDTYVYINSVPNQNRSDITGDGTANKPWDYFHINAIDKNAEGDYLVSSRHTGTIFKVAGLGSTTGHSPGDIVWRLGGRHNDFNMLDGLVFSWQHAVRFQATTADTTEITLFDNGSNGPVQDTDTSSGIWISVNNVSMEASLIHRYSPPTQLSADASGQLQRLPNDNVVIGWGTLPYYSEYTVDGDLLYHAHYGRPGQDNMQSYRVWKFPWLGLPVEAPTLFLYSRTCSNDSFTAAYVSWNGATQVATWQLHVSSTTHDGPFTALSQADWSGFETLLDAGLRTRFAYAEALDSDGTVLARTNTIATFVPKDTVAVECGRVRCGDGFEYIAANAKTCNGDDDNGGGDDGGGVCVVVPLPLPSQYQ